MIIIIVRKKNKLRSIDYYNLTSNIGRSFPHKYAAKVSQHADVPLPQEDM